MSFLKRIEISGYKSIKDIDLELRRLNILIGANGSGKSNLLSFFKLIREMLQGRLQFFVGKEGGADTLLFYGSKTTKNIEAYLHLDDNGNLIIYKLRMIPTARDSLQFEREKISFRNPNGNSEFGCGLEHNESQLAQSIDIWRSHNEDLAVHAGEIVVQAIKHWGIFGFYDTSVMRLQRYIHDNSAIHSDGNNLVAILYKIRETQVTAYHRIVETIRQIAPWFGDFVIEPLELNKNNVQLNWRDRYSDKVFGPHQLPDGGLRAIALVTLLLQSTDNLPSLIVIDEPELGLHPNAICIIAALLKQASLHCQIIVATQSPTFLDEFDPEDVIVVDREEGKSLFTRQDPEKLREWLEEYSLGELWQKNSIGGGPF